MFSSANIKIIVKIIALVLCLLGLTVMAGWFLHIPEIIQVNISWAPMQFNTALGMFLCGLGLFISNDKYQRFKRLLGFSVMVFAILTAGQYVFGRNWGVDEFFIIHDITTLSANPGRMAPNTAIAFTIMGLALSASTILKLGVAYQIVMSLCGAVLLGIASSALLGYVSAVDTSILWTQLTKMAVHTALGFMLCGVALLLPYSNIKTIEQRWGAVQVGLPLMIVMFVIATTLALSIHNNENKNLHNSLQKSAQMFFSILELDYYYSQKPDKWVPFVETRLVIDRFVQQIMAENIAVKLTDAQTLIYESKLEKQNLSGVELKFHNQYAGKTYQLILQPSLSWVESFHSKLPYVILIVSGLTALLLLMSLFFLQRARARGLVLEQESAKNILLANDIKTVFDSSPVGMLMVDEAGLINTANQEALAIFGYSDAELVSKPVEILMPNAEKEKHVALRQSFFADASKRRMGLGMDIFGLRKDATKVPLEVGLSPVNTERGPMMIASIVDITEKKSQDHELSLYMQALEHSNSELNEFAHMASHDLRAPLRGVKQLAGWIREEIKNDLNQKATEYFDLLDVRVNRMQKLQNDLLQYASLSATSDIISVVDCKALVETCFEMSSANGSATLILKGPRLPIINTAKTPLELVFRNLITNAIKHSNRADTIVTVSFEPTDNDFWFHVEDNGLGISLTDQEKIFSMFKRLKSRDEVEGSGVGLALVKKIMSTFGGEVVVSSDGIKGTVFSFRWPAEAAILSVISVIKHVKPS